MEVVPLELWCDLLERVERLEDLTRIAQTCRRAREAVGLVRRLDLDHTTRNSWTLDRLIKIFPRLSSFRGLVQLKTNDRVTLSHVRLHHGRIVLTLHDLSSIRQLGSSLVGGYNFHRHYEWRNRVVYQCRIYILGTEVSSNYIILEPGRVFFLFVYHDLCPRDEFIDENGYLRNDFFSHRSRVYQAMIPCLEELVTSVVESYLERASIDWIFVTAPFVLPLGCLERLDRAGDFTLAVEPSLALSYVQRVRRLHVSTLDTFRGYDNLFDLDSFIQVGSSRLEVLSGHLFNRLNFHPSRVRKAIRTVWPKLRKLEFWVHKSLLDCFTWYESGCGFFPRFRHDLFLSLEETSSSRISPEPNRPESLIRWLETLPHSIQQIVIRGPPSLIELISTSQPIEPRIQYRPGPGGRFQLKQAIDLSDRVVPPHDPT